MSINRSEIVIIGAGVMGNSIAYHLARQGHHVLVLERSEVAISPAASWASAGGVRRQGRHPAEAPLASEAISRWPTLEQELEADLHYRQGGNLLLAESETEAAYLAGFVQHQQAMGFTDVRLIDRQQALKLAPGLNDRVLAGSFSPADGQADPPRTTRAFAQAAQRHGATYQENTPVLALLHQGEHITGVSTPQGEIQADLLILATGAWSNSLLQPLGLRLPMRPYALQMLLSTPAPSKTLQPVLSAVGRHLSLKQRLDGSYLLGGGWLGNPAPNLSGYTLRPSSIEGNWQAACELLPAVAQQRIARSWCGLEAESFDTIPFSGPAPGFSNLILAVGFSGHGFALSPAIGRAVADLINGKPVPELDNLSPARILNFPVNEVEAFLTKTDEENTLE